MDRRTFIKLSSLAGGAIALLPGCVNDQAEKTAKPASSGPPALPQIVPHVERAFVVVKDLEVMQADYAGLPRVTIARVSAAGQGWYGAGTAPL